MSKLYIKDKPSLEEIELAKTKYTDLHNEVVEMRDRLNLYKNYLSKKEEYTKIKSMLETVLVKQKLYNKTLKAMKDFSSYLNSIIVPSVEKVANTIFVSITNGKYSQLSLDKNFNIKIDGVDLMGRFSKGETVLANLSLRLGLSSFIKSAHSAPIDSLIMDEISSSFDSNRKERTMEAISGLKDKYRQILLITHDNLEMSFADNLIEVS
jgi:DNA repair exonuclease SbcCD ATPase subunit